MNTDPLRDPVCGMTVKLDTPHQLQHDGRPLGSPDSDEYLRCSVEGPVANLPGVVTDTLDVSTGSEVHADQESTPPCRDEAASTNQLLEAS